MNYRKRNQNLISIGCIIFSFALIIYPQSSLDFLIVKSPQALTILNKYEQKISSEERNNFLPYSPFQILVQDELLGDQLSKAMKVKYQGEVYFLSKDEKGKLSGIRKAGYYQFFKRAKPLDDTIVILKSKSLSFSSKYGTQGTRSYFKKNDLVIRVLQYRNHYYLLGLGENRQYGWSNLLPNKSWEMYNQGGAKEKIAEASSSPLNSHLRERLISRIQTANKTYKQLFTFFNQLSGQQKAIPQWKMSKDKHQIRFLLTGSNHNSGELGASTKLLVQEIKNMVIGDPLSVRYAKGVISIVPIKKD